MKTKPTKQRDHLRDRLQQLAATGRAGSEQAKRALNDEPKAKKPPIRKRPSQPKKTLTAKARGKASKVSVSLHPEDQERIDAILASLPGRCTVSDAVKVALAGLNIDEKEFVRLLKQVRSRDLRRK